VLVRPGKVDDAGVATALRFGKPGLSGVYLGTPSGTFEGANTLQVSLGVPYETWSTQPFGIDIRDVDGDGARDLAVNRFNWSESIYLKHRGFYGTTPNVEAGTVLGDVLALSEQVVEVKLDETPESSAIGLKGKLNRLGYRLVDVDGDGREDFVAALAPFAPNSTLDPQTGSYGPSATFEPNTYTDLRLHLQRAPERRISVELPAIQVDAGDQILRVRLKLTNLAKTRADNVRVRLLTHSIPLAYHLTPAMLAAEYDTYAAEVRAMIDVQEATILGNPLGDDLLIPRIEPGATLVLEVAAPVAFVNDLVGYALYAVVDPETTRQVLYKTAYDFIE